MTRASRHVPAAVLAALMILITVFAASCSQQGAPTGTPARRDHGTLTLAQPAEPATLNPLFGDPTAQYFGAIVYSYLFAVDDRGELVPDVALDVPRPGHGISSDGRTITYHLRGGVRWQDGRPLTARDAAFTYRAVMDPRDPVADRTGYDRIDSVSAPDDLTLVVRLRAPFAPIVSTFLVNYPILPEHVLAGVGDLSRAAFSLDPVGSGPYRLVKWVRGDHMEFAANPSYWRGPPRIGRLIMRFVPASDTLLTQLRTHEADGWFGATSAEYPQLRFIPATTIKFVWTTAFTDFLFNLKDPIVADARVRRALGMALDRTNIVADVSYGVYVPTDGDQSPLSWAFDPTSPALPYDPAAARRMLDDDGWRIGPDGVREKNGKHLDLSLAYVGGYKTARSLAMLALTQWRAIGAGVEARPYSTAQLYGPDGILASGRFQISFDFRSLTGTDPDDSFLWRCSAAPPAGQNYARFCDPEVDAALDRALATYDRTVRTREYRFVARRLAESLPAIFLYRGRSIAVMPDDLEGVRRSSSASDFWSIWQWHFRD